MIDKLDFIWLWPRSLRPCRRSLRRGQPTLSAGVKQLESRWACCWSIAARAEVHPQGQRVLDWAPASSKYRAMREEINSLHRSLTGRLRIAAIRPRDGRS
jgi:hypothetical protein